MDFHSIKINPDMNAEKIYAAYMFAKIKHEGQIRRFTKEPYFTHPLGVAIAISELSKREYMIKAALMHDLIEDTDTTYYDIKRLFGNKTAKLVGELTMDKTKKEEYGGKKLYLTFLINKMSNDAFTLKLVDRLDNVIGLSSNDVPSSFIKWYVKETTYILDNLDRKPNDIQLWLISKIRKELSKH